MRIRESNKIQTTSEAGRSYNRSGLEVQTMTVAASLPIEPAIPQSQRRAVPPGPWPLCLCCLCCRAWEPSKSLFRQTRRRKRARSATSPLRPLPSPLLSVVLWMRLQIFLRLGDRRSGTFHLESPPCHPYVCPTPRILLYSDAFPLVGLALILASWLDLGPASWPWLP
jgi:hypothetical protein